MIFHEGWRCAGAVQRNPSCRDAKKVSEKNRETIFDLSRKNLSIKDPFYIKCKK